MAPLKAVCDVKTIADELVDGFAVVTESNRWIRVTVFGSWDGVGDLQTALKKQGYRVKDHTTERVLLKITKQGLHWPHQQ